MFKILESVSVLMLALWLVLMKANMREKSLNFCSAQRLYDSNAVQFGDKQGSRWRAKKSPCGCSLRFVLVPKEKWKSPCDFTKSLY